MTFDAVIVGSGPNGLAAAITLAQAGLTVAIYEGKDTIGGGMRSSQLTLPGFIHDICSTVYPFASGSPFFRSLPLEKHGLQWIHPHAPLAHPFDDGSAALLERSILNTTQYLGIDASAYTKLMQPLADIWDQLEHDLYRPLHFPRFPVSLARFAFLGSRSAENLVNSRFKEEKARSLFLGLAAHANMKLNQPLTAAFGLVLGMLGHLYGWPLSSGGSCNLANALSSYFFSLGGKIYTNQTIEDLDQFSQTRLIFLDITPRQVLQLGKNHLPNTYLNKLARYRYGPGIYKIDWALSGPIPWKAKETLRAGTVHVCGGQEEIKRSENEVGAGKNPEKPFVLLVQPSLFDSARAPEGKHTAWGYCHVPNGSEFDMTGRIERQIERFAPGFQDCILARHTITTKALEQYNPNYVGGDINGGVQDLWQFFTRPVARLVPYSTPSRRIYICSSSTPPGGGVHGLCGYYAAKAALKTLVD